MTKEGAECLVAREVPLAVNDVEDSLTSKLDALAIEEIKRDKPNKDIQPADFVTLQSIRSSALARKTNTTSKLASGTQALFVDLLNKSSDEDSEEENEEEDKKEVKKEEKAEKEAKEEKDEKDEKEEEKKDELKNEDTEDDEEDDKNLISRGPVRNVRTPVVHHPYAGRPVQYGTAAQSTVDDYSAYSGYGMGYECGVNFWQDSPDTMYTKSSSSTPDTIQSSSDHGYASSMSPQDSPFTDHMMTPHELTRVLTTDRSDLPEGIAEFILSYSHDLSRREEENIMYNRPSSTTSSCNADSPMSAGSAPHYSPGAPHSGMTGSHSPSSITPIATDRPARLRLRTEIGQGAIEKACLWVCKCVQMLPEPDQKKHQSAGILTWQDKDHDSILHLVINNNDVAKAYAIVEQQLKLDFNPSVPRPWDLANRHDQTPLMLAVMHRNPQLVAYFLELSSDPNKVTNYDKCEGPLHYAANRGMEEITQLLLKDPRINIELTDRDGMTPLMSAIYNNGSFDDYTKQTIDNRKIVQLLLDNHADPSKTCSSEQGRNIYHLAASKCDITMMELLSKAVDDDISTKLANAQDFSLMKPMNIIDTYKKAGRIDDAEYQRCFFALLTCNANVERSSPTPSK